jgi:hypothetical protein
MIEGEGMTHWYSCDLFPDIDPLDADVCDAFQEGEEK